MTTVTPFQIEAWSEYGVGLLIIFLRIFVRCRQIGFEWEGDDWFAFISIFFWTAELVMLELIGQFGSITGMSNEIALTLTDKQVADIVTGSKCLLAGWCLYVTLIWCLKACMLFLYNRLTFNLKQRKAVKFTAITCVLAYISTIVVILTHCLPLSRLWQVYPYPGDGCALNIPNYLALVVTNVITDIMILWIPLPLLWSVQLPIERKILYGAWLCTGVFIMVATLLRCIICLGDVSQINVGTIWSIRETFVGIIAVNVPVLKPFFARTVKTASNLAGYSNKSMSKDNTGATSNHELSRIEKRMRRQDRLRRGAAGLTTMDNDSQEKIVKDYDSHGKNHDVSVWTGSMHTTDSVQPGIQVTKGYDVETGHR